MLGEKHLDLAGAGSAEVRNISPPHPASIDADRQVRQRADSVGIQGFDGLRRKPVLDRITS